MTFNINSDPSNRNSREAILEVPVYNIIFGKVWTEDVDFGVDIKSMYVFAEVSGKAYRVFAKRDQVVLFQCFVSRFLRDVHDNRRCYIS